MRLLSLAVSVLFVLLGCGQENPGLIDREAKNGADNTGFIQQGPARAVANTQPLVPIQKPKKDSIKPIEGPYDDDKGIFKAVKGNPEVVFDKRIVDAGFPVEFSEIYVRTNFNIPPAKEVEHDFFEYKGNDFSVDVFINLIDGSDNVVIVDRGKMIQVPIRASCVDVQFVLDRGLGEIRATIRKTRPAGSTASHFELEDVEVNWPKDAWRVVIPEGSCVGNVEIEEVLRSEAMKELNSAQEEASKEVRNAIMDYFRDWADEHRANAEAKEDVHEDRNKRIEKLREERLKREAEEEAKKNKKNKDDKKAD